MFGDIGECPISIVAIQNASSVLRHVNVRIAIAVVIANGDAHAEAAPAYASLFGDVSKCAVTIVVVEGVVQRLRRV